LGNAQCPSCGASVAPPVEGSLAPDPATLSPAPKTEPLREIPALRKRERTWKDEVRERVRHRRQTRSGDLPLFDQPEPEPEAAPGPEDLSDEEPTFRESVAVPEPEEEPQDLPMRSETVEEESFSFRTLPDEEALEEEATDEPDPFSIGLPPSEEAPRPVERPALPTERMAAASIDVLCLLALWSLTLYFAARISHTTVRGLEPAWRYLAAYFAFVGLYYAAYFTGTTGQTLGKILLGLRVVNTAGAPPGYLRALMRAVVGVLGIAAAFLGMLPVFFDPARRALHDRLFRTRVVKG
jgi:uncharacterized RDD family membrane protein YckC